MKELMYDINSGVILDLDRPRRGLIEVSQQSLTDLQGSLRADLGAGSKLLK